MFCRHPQLFHFSIVLYHGRCFVVIKMYWLLSKRTCQVALSSLLWIVSRASWVETVCISRPLNTALCNYDVHVLRVICSEVPVEQKNVGKLILISKVLRPCLQYFSNIISSIIQYSCISIYVCHYMLILVQFEWHNAKHKHLTVHWRNRSVSRKAQLVPFVMGTSCLNACFNII